jgi:peptidyl-prolyl cis-trans isomerase SurA
MPSADGQTLLTLQQVLIPFSRDIKEDKAREIMAKIAEISHEAKNCPSFEKIAKDKFPSSSAHLSQNNLLMNFPDPLQEVINDLSLNQASEPLLTEDGALLVMVCDKQSQKIQELSSEDAKKIIANRKHSLLGKRELRDLRSQATIEVRM